MKKTKSYLDWRKEIRKKKVETLKIILKIYITIFDLCI